MKIDRGGAFTEWLFQTNETKLLYWKKKWFGKVDNPYFEHPQKDQNSVSMDAYFWSDGDISLHIDNVKVMSYTKENLDQNGQGKLEITNQP